MIPVGASPSLPEFLEGRRCVFCGLVLSTVVSISRYVVVADAEPCGKGLNDPSIGDSGQPQTEAFGQSALKDGMKQQ